MKIIGLTGGIGSGKTVVSELLSVYGIPVYDSDFRSKALCDTDEKLKQGLRNLFGPEVYVEDRLNRPYMAGLVFGRPDMLEATNKLIHPAVEQDFRRWVSLQENEIVVQETAILFEAGLEDRYDWIVCVTAPESLRLQRACQRNGMSTDDVLARMKNQISETDRISRSDFLLVNDGIEPLIPQVESLLAALLG
jgi:dephospho-CoA kinase